jgi:hypothetical protein
MRKYFLETSWRLQTSWRLPGDFLETSWKLPGDFPELFTDLDSFASR